MKQHIETAGKHIRRSPYQALAAILIMFLTFFVATFLAILAYASQATLQYFETRPQIIAFLKADATTENIASLQKKLETDSRVKDIRYVSKEQALSIYREATSNNPLLSELVSPKVFPASLEFSVAQLSFAEELIKEVEKQDAVEQVVFTASLGGQNELGNVIANLKRVTNYVRIGGSVILGFLLTSSLIVLLVIIGMRIASRRDEIETLQLMGATAGFIRTPFIFEGIFYAVIGSILGWITAVILILYSMPSLIAYFGDIPVLPRDTLELLKLFGMILGAQIVLALTLGTIGSLVSLRRYLKI